MKAETGVMNQAVKSMHDREGKYLTFSLGKEEYGIGILKIKEIIGMMPITPVPQTPEYIKGVVNLRGKVIPVLDLRLRFGMEKADYTERTCIIVVEITGDAGKVMMGIVVDAVSDLPVAFREVITLRFEEEMKLEEIASVLGLPMGTVKTRLHRAMKALRISLVKKLESG